MSSTMADAFVNADSSGRILAVDVGTSSARVSMVARDGSVVAHVVTGGGQDSPDGDFDLEQLWARLSTAIADVVAIAGQPDAVAVAAQLGTVFLDEALRPVGPVLSWQDRRAASFAEALAVDLGAEAIAVAGRRPAPEHAAACALWFSDTTKDGWSRTRWIVTVKDAINARLTGNVVTDATSASYSLLFDVVLRKWSEALSDAAHVPIHRLPPVLGAAESVGAITAVASVATGLREGIVVAVGGPDGSVGALGAGLVEVGTTVDIAGTTDVLLHAVDRPVVDRTGRSLLNAYLLPGMWTIGGPTGMTGGAIAWLCRLLGFPAVEEAFDRLGSQAATLAPGSDGVRFYPSLTGERFPHWRGDADAMIAGLRAHHGPAHLLHAAEEGCAFLLREGLEALGDLGFPVTSVHVSGGVSRRRQTMQLRAAAWDRKVIPLATTQATTTGSAILAAVCGGTFASVQDAAQAMVGRAEAVIPDGAAVLKYDNAYRTWSRGRRLNAEVTA
ncbi:FGGY-family carbohydrate kinase [Microbacterium sp. BWT-B31]|uniref:xylulokinase n=1 Tax=Microbacterium sp. BWT-B31 TaxID=3232072 RepID=UPI003528F97A